MHQSIILMMEFVNGVQSFVNSVILEEILHRDDRSISPTLLFELEMCDEIAEKPCPIKDDYSKNINTISGKDNCNALKMRNFFVLNYEPKIPLYGGLRGEIC